MNAADVIRRLHQHRIWANLHLREAVAKLSPEALRQTFAIGQGSIWKSLLHLYAAEYVWLESLSGNEAGVAPGDVAGKLPGNQEGPDPIATLEKLEADWTALDARWQNYLAGLPVEALDQPVVKTAVLWQAGWAAIDDAPQRCATACLHACRVHHGTSGEHAAPELGGTPLPDPMLISMARQEMGDNR